MLGKNWVCVQGREQDPSSSQPFYVAADVNKLMAFIPIEDTSRNQWSYRTDFPTVVGPVTRLLNR